MQISFTKLHGLGNDFVLIDARSKRVKLNQRQIRFIGDRKRGVGFDQLLLLEKSKRKAYVKVHIYNTDGSRAEMCGNGLRAVGRYLFNRDAKKLKQITVETDVGLRGVSFINKDLVETSMGVPAYKKLSKKFTKKNPDADFVDVGNPHLVFSKFPKTQKEFESLGAKYEVDPEFKNRTNVEFVRPVSKDTVEVKVWERGVGETEACGSGAVACAFVTLAKVIRFKGGTAKVRFSASGEAFLTGPAVEVYSSVLVV